MVRRYNCCSFVCILSLTLSLSIPSLHPPSPLFPSSLTPFPLSPSPFSSPPSSHPPSPLFPFSLTPFLLSPSSSSSAPPSLPPSLPPPVQVARLLQCQSGSVFLYSSEGRRVREGDDLAQMSTQTLYVTARVRVCCCVVHVRKDGRYYEVWFV